MDLSGLLYPVTLERFIDNYWEKDILHIQRGVDGYYGSVLTQSEVEAYINAEGNRYPALQLSKSGHYLSPEVFCKDFKAGSASFSAEVDRDRVIAEYRAGATVSLPALHRRTGALSQICNHMADLSGHAVHANVYLTPGNAEGFSPHYDTHDVFVLQIAGRKFWKIYEPTQSLPHVSDPYAPESFTVSNPCSCITLNPGDLLYLPRGYIHATSTDDTYSLHVTLGLTVYTYLELISVWMGLAKQNLEFRRSLPFGFHRHPRLLDEIGDQFSALAIEALGPSALTEMLASFMSRRIENKSWPSASFQFCSDEKLLNANTELISIPVSQYSYRIDGDNIIIEVAGKSLAVTARAEPLLHQIRASKVFSVSGLVSPFTEEATLKLVRHFYQEGLVDLVVVSK
jgi:ribosomal protein L16 Arg81 hydroxylase